MARLFFMTAVYLSLAAFVAIVGAAALEMGGNLSASRHCAISGAMADALAEPVTACRRIGGAL